MGLARVWISPIIFYFSIMYVQFTKKQLSSVQDSRLLGEIHISLLRSIIKDIEDVARAPSMGVGANQNCAANPGGGHPQIVEGVRKSRLFSASKFSLCQVLYFAFTSFLGMLFQAYAWGFDIKSWKCNLNPLTWPEILRQFAVSAGFGPQLKKRGVEPAYLHEDNEVTYLLK